MDECGSLNEMEGVANIREPKMQVKMKREMAINAIFSTHVESY